MKTHYIWIVAILFILGGCKCQKVQSIDELNTSASSFSKIEGFLMEPTFDLISAFSEIKVYNIQSSPIEGTVDEYSNKLIFQHTLANGQAEVFVKNLLNDASYTWSLIKEEQNSFSPTKQILIKDTGGQLNLMYDPTARLLGFINLEGQQILPVTQAFHQLLMSL